MLQWLPVPAAAAVGYFGWGFGLTPLTLVFIALWASCRHRAAAFACAVAYYLAGSRVIPAAADVFFLDQANLLQGFGLWVFGAIILSIPWTVLYTRSDKHLWWKLLAIIALLSVPPFGWIGWLNPLLGASLVIPGMGWWSIAAGSTLAIAAAYVARGAINDSTRPFYIPGLALLICVIAISIVWIPQTRPAPDGWVGLNTQLGQEPSPGTQTVLRQYAIEDLVREQLAAGARVIVLPELVVGRWSASTEEFLFARLAPALRKHNATLLLGAGYPDPRQPNKHFNAVVAFDGHAWEVGLARHVVPISMWRPWAAETFVPLWRDNGLLEVDGLLVSTSICFEDYVIWPHLISFIAGPPQAIVAPANFWWVKGSGADRIQNEHIEAWGRIFNVPVIRSANES